MNRSRSCDRGEPGREPLPSSTETSADETFGEVASTLPSVIIRASAGTGKTYQLTSRYMALLQQALPERMLASTFTRKAAGEILERILQELARESEDSTTAESIAGRYAMLQKFTQHLHRVRIGTLDSFFVQVGTAISLELGLPPGWRILDESEEAQLRLKTVDTLLQRESTTDVLRLTHLMSKGKPDSRVTSLLLETVQKYHELYQLTEPEAWNRLQPPPRLTNDEVLATIEELSRLNVPDLKSWREAHETSLQCARNEEWNTFLTKGLPKNILQGEPKYRGREIPAELLPPYRRLIEHAQAVLLQQIADWNRATRELLDRYHREWQQALRDVKGETFFGVTLRLAEYFRPSDGTGQDQDGDLLQRIAFRLDSQIDHLLLDEFQDTSTHQWMVLEPLARQVLARPEGSLLCVGDEKQAIYSWRGGLSDLFTQLPERLQQVEVQNLNQSWRSAPEVLETVNQVFEQLDQHPNLKDEDRAAIETFQRGYQRHTTARPELVGYTVYQTVPSDKDAVLDRTVELVGQLLRDAPGCSIGILTRTNDRIRTLIAKLRAAGLEASEEGKSSVTDSAAVQILLSLLKLADQPGDTVAGFHVASSPLARVFGLSPLTLPSFSERWQTSECVRRQLLHRGYASALADWADFLLPLCDARETLRLRQLIELADQFQPAATLRTTDFLKFVDQAKVQSPTQAPVRVMTIHAAKGLQFDVTILCELEAKLGPENAPNFVCSRPDPFSPPEGICRYEKEELQPLCPPNIQRSFSETRQAAVLDALCLLYVAMTRAIRALYLIGSQPSKQDAALPVTFDGMLRATLCSGRVLQPDEIVEHGNPRWYEHLGAPESRSVREQSMTAVRQPIPFAPSSAEHMRLRRAAPSREVLSSRVRLPEMMRSVSRTALNRGTLIHAWFESIRWLDDGFPTRDTLLSLARQLHPLELDVEACLQQFQAMLNHPEIALTLSRRSYQPPNLPGLSAHVQSELAAGPLELQVETERRFTMFDEGRLVTGVVDRLVLMARADTLLAADILDYKTDSDTAKDTPWAQEQAEHYRRQLAGYVRAVAHLYALDPERISARLIWLRTGQVESVTMTPQKR